MIDTYHIHKNLSTHECSETRGSREAYAREWGKDKVMQKKDAEVKEEVANMMVTRKMEKKGKVASTETNRGDRE